MDFFSFIDSKDVVLIGEAKQSFGRKLKQLRKSQQMTMDQMTRDFPITKPTIVKLEKGDILYWQGDVAEDSKISAYIRLIIVFFIINNFRH